MSWYERVSKSVKEAPWVEWNMKEGRCVGRITDPIPFRPWIVSGEMREKKNTWGERKMFMGMEEKCIPYGECENSSSSLVH